MVLDTPSIPRDGVQKGDIKNNCKLPILVSNPQIFWVGGIICDTPYTI